MAWGGVKRAVRCHRDASFPLSRLVPLPRARALTAMPFFWYMLPLVKRCMRPPATENCRGGRAGPVLQVPLRLDRLYTQTSKQGAAARWHVQPVHPQRNLLHEWYQRGQYLPGTLPRGGSCPPQQGGTRRPQLGGSGGSGGMARGGGGSTSGHPPSPRRQSGHPLPHTGYRHSPGGAAQLRCQRAAAGGRSGSRGCCPPPGGHT